MVLTEEKTYEFLNAIRDAIRALDGEIYIQRNDRYIKRAESLEKSKELLNELYALLEANKQTTEEGY